MPTSAKTSTGRSRPGSRTGSAPDVHNSTRVVVGFPFSTIHVQPDEVTDRLAELLTRLARELNRQHPSPEAAAIADSAHALAGTSTKH